MAERCTTRLGRQNKAMRDARDDRKLNPEEQVLRVPLTRDGILQAWGRVRTVRHLVEKHNVDINSRCRDGMTALDVAEESGKTECASYLRELGATNRWSPTETESSSDEDMDSDDDSV